ncbi:MAG: helix-turn-helix domain-containing protein [bacterium]
MRPIDTKYRIKAIKQYLSGSTLEQTAALFKIHRNTLWRWVKMYKQGGMKFFTKEDSFIRHWKRLSKGIEESVITIKESLPWLTVRKAQKMLKKRGIQISIKGVWSIWQRYGLTGFAKEETSHSYQEYLSTVISQDVLNKIKQLISENKLRQAAKIINALPVFPYNEIILKIPQHMLSLHKQVNRVRAEFGKTPLTHYRKKTKALSKKLEKHNLFYSALWVTVAECYALMWSGEPRKVLKLVKAVKRKIKGIRDPRLRFLTLLLEGQANGSLLRIKKAKSCADKCKVIVRSSSNPHFLMGGLGGIYSTMGYYRDALYWTTKALQGAAPSYQQQLYVNVAQFCGTSGNYRAALSALKKGKFEEWGFRSRSSLIKTYAYLDQGDFQKAAEHAVTTLEQLKKEGVRSLLHPAMLCLASCHRAADEYKKASTMIRDINPLLKKYGLMQEYWQRRIILGDTCVPKEALRMPSLRLAYLLQKAKQSMHVKDYRRTLAYAHSQKLFGLFMRLVPFFPEPVIHLLQKGKNPGLPRTFLKMPVFQIDTPVYNVMFLGKLQVLKRGKLLRRLRLSPKDTSFLIHMSMNKNRRVFLEELYQNFWTKSKNPSRNLSHLLMRIRRKLAIPSHLLRFRAGTLCWDVYFTTDYENFKENLAQAKVFERAGEWNYAVRGYERSFRLIKDTPFKGIYDNWSENTRRVILNRLESEMQHFAQSCRTHKNMQIYHRILSRLSKIVPL